MLEIFVVGEIRDRGNIESVFIPCELGCHVPLHAYVLKMNVRGPMKISNIILKDFAASRLSARGRHKPPPNISGMTNVTRIHLFPLGLETHSLKKRLKLVERAMKTKIEKSSWDVAIVTEGGHLPGAS